MATLIIISWRDIPAQVVGRKGRETAKAPLSPRFQEAVDRAAMRAGRGTSNAYLEDWKRSPPRPCGEDIAAEVAAEAARARLASALRGRRGGGQNAGQTLHRAPAQPQPIRVQCRAGGAHPATYAVRR